MKDLKLDILKERYSWPTRIPQLGFDDHGWLAHSTKLQLARCLSESTELVVECGSWLGLSTRFILEEAPNAAVIALDHWRGSPEHHEIPECQQRLGRLYESFLRNCWNYQDRLIPMRKSTLQGLEEIADLNLQPDLIYLDADHSYKAVHEDLESIARLFPSTVVVGDDWWWASVKSAVYDFTSAHDDFIFTATGNAWVLENQSGSILEQQAQL
jgi:hypothetical protein